MAREHYIGIMSGTSLDGVDVVLCEIDSHSCTLIHSIEYPFPSELKAELLSMIAGTCTLEEVGRADHSLGVLFTEAVASLLVSHNIDASTITAIGSHGQTLWHDPVGEYAFSMQLGDPNIISVKTGIPVVADFRRKDVALGGQGAPFAPAFHEFIFNNIKSSVSVVNIGGMANITVLAKNNNENLIGYDTGCGNVLLDMWITKQKGLSYDIDGVWSKSGKINYTLLDTMMTDEYFSLPYPKSTGREKFNEAWLDDMLKATNKGIPLQDVQRTLVELTALSISNEVLKFNSDIVLLCGGGAKNTFLVERIKALMPNVEVSIAQNADELEAMTFAWLAYKRIHKEKVNLKEVTGAKENTILGAIYA
ncbi:MAG: anhydro-N-acetylmuramic acid kinase [Sulfurovum sp.]|nr:anhydro-N-acetylmuramic acid kinase [Sulfurovum sp.]